MTLKEDLHAGRILSIDVLRGLTILTMIFVNELSGISDVPWWMKHIPPDQDGMTFVDVVFPGFLFIVGMSIPFSFNARLRKGHSSPVIWKHTLWRTAALMIMGLYMVNIEFGYDASKMLIPPAIWGLLAYTVPILVWNHYPKKWSPTTRYVLQVLGLLVFLVMHLLYVQDGGERGMTIKWWGILGLIAWAYLYSALVYWFGKGQLVVMLGFLAVFIFMNSMNSAGITENWLAGNWRFVGSHFSHASIVMCGLILSLLYFDKKQPGLDSKFMVFVAALFALAWALKPMFGVSKQGATPSWCLFSAVICSLLFAFLYWLIEQKGKDRWTTFFMPAAKDPLLIYILPGILIYICKSLGIWYRPDFFSTGLMGILWSVAFSIAMLYLVKLLNHAGVKLRL